MQNQLFNRLTNYQPLQCKQLALNSAWLLKNTGEDSRSALLHNRQLQTLFQHIPGMVFELCLTAGDHASLPFVSAGIATLYELNPEQLTEDASALFDLIHPDDRDDVTTSLQESASSLHTWNIEYRVNLAQKGLRWLSVTANPVKQRNGTIIWYGFNSDITERNQLIIAAKEHAEHLVNTKSQFLATMSHEIRTPMTAIIGFSDLALLNELPEETYDYIKNINIASKDLLAIINDIMDSSKLEAGLMTLQLEGFKLSDLQVKLQGLLANMAQAKGLSLTIDIAANIPKTLMGDSLRLRQVLLNLLSNAIKFTQQGSVNLSISLQQLDASVARLLFSVTDTGMGISAEQQDKLFQPFSQAEDSYVRNQAGTGLGLIISQNLVQLMGANIKLESQIGLGCCFSFELILPLPLSTIDVGVTQNLEPLSGVRILVADDNDLIKKVINGQLKRYGANIVLASNGLEALAALEQQPFDMVLMDLHMPSMNGYETALEIRKIPRYAQLPVIAFSASVTEEEQRCCLDSGMNDFIAKPIDKVELLATLQRWVGCRV